MEAAVAYFKGLYQRLTQKTGEIRCVSDPGRLDYKAGVLTAATPDIRKGNMYLSEMADTEFLHVRTPVIYRVQGYRKRWTGFETAIT